MKDFHMGNRLQQLQSEKGVSSAELARILDSTPQQVHRWRNQQCLNMSSTQRVCEALNIKLAEFFAPA